MTSLKVQATTTQILPLENGDRLTRLEFERRYTAMPKLKKAELIEGIVYMGSPVRAKSHGQPHAAIMAMLSAYWIATPGVSLLDNATVRLDLDNEPQPDALLRIESGGRSIVSDDDYVEGAPELIVEIAAVAPLTIFMTKSKYIAVMEFKSTLSGRFLKISLIGLVSNPVSMCHYSPMIME